MENTKHIHQPEPGRFVLGVCKRGHTAMNQVYCIECKKLYCKACYAGDKTINQGRIEAGKKLKELGL